MLGRAGSRGALRVDAVLQLLARLEARRLARRMLERLARLRIAARARRGLAHAEGAEAAEVDLVAARQRVRHELEHVLHELLYLRLGGAGLARDRVDQVGLLHLS